ncbi:hypothetical protein [Legionella sp. km772]|uniref:hypothetical protein n=1 Tax=Legionella sp. km772 TaxID=2498111 RepID=UPI000F8C5EE0|nr:hypothetical protein [Legionella sp. km772]RUR12814.1 hypothetical protein ELY15_04040 [Legionella sp. km772]
MDEKLTGDEFSKWFSTYGLITSQRILGHYKISIPQKELIPAIKSATSFYHHLVQVPLKNVLNGIVLQQANDYHIYVQKLFIDYLLSGESGKPPEAQGAATRESLENERKALVSLGEQFNQKQLDHEAVIGTSQKILIKLSTDLKESMANSANSLHHLTTRNNSDFTKEQIVTILTRTLIEAGIELKSQNIDKNLFIDKAIDLLHLSKTEGMKEKLNELLNEFFNVLSKVNEQISELFNTANSITESARAFRSQFYQAALRVIELMKLLPEYKIDPEQDMINREALHFDKTIGETQQ